MNDPKRLTSASENNLERILLRAARVEAPSGAKERALLAVSAALAASSVTAGVASASPVAASAKAASVAALKWMGVLSLTGASAVTGAVVLHRALASAPHASVAATVSSRGQPAEMRATATETVSTAATLPTARESLAPAPTHPASAAATATTRSSLRSTEPGAPTASTLPVELALLERARAAMGAGELTRALSLLDGYAIRYPRGAMAPEAAVLRIETLVKTGDRPAATRFANAFLATAPHSPYAARIQSLLAAPSP
jgi:hypothetical protein